MGAKLTHLDLFGPIADQVKIPQESVKDTPTEKLYDGFIGILSGAQGIVEVNKLVRSDPGLQKAFGRDRCTEQPVIQETLDASTVETIYGIYLDGMPKEAIPSQIHPHSQLHMLFLQAQYPQGHSYPQPSR